ncbi:MAG TPA: hypothetical protein VN772_06770 [Solirubrobacteraceae bacterium]|nr:hypothetical protein [Solirubrobacteraceae bacterium]
MTAAITLHFDLPARFLDDRGERTGFVLLAAFLLTFLFIRTSARLIRSPRVSWWPGSVTTGSGLHLHHLVWGIVLLLVTGFLGFALSPVSPWEEILAGGFGVGAGLTLDEFALWVYLRDVYWAEEGRASLDAVVVAAALGGLIVLGIAPFDLPNNSSSVSTLVSTVLIVLALSTMAILKGRPFLGLIGIFIPLTSIAGACRLASPGSPWARRFYAEDAHKLARAQARFERTGERRRRLADAISGAPSEQERAAARDGGEEARPDA